MNTKLKNNIRNVLKGNLCKASQDSFFIIQLNFDFFIFLFWKILFQTFCVKYFGILIRLKIDIKVTLHALNQQLSIIIKSTVYWYFNLAFTI